MSNLEGVILSDYFLLQCISKGGIADVYRARQQGEGNYEVAVKVFRTGYAQQESFRSYFMAEAEKIGQFDHPNILPFLEFGEGEGLLYVVTPFMTAGTLDDLLTRVGGRFPAMQALPILQQLCSAIEYAHSRDVIHGNIKPNNIFLGTDGRVLLSDFGIARSYDDSQQSLTRVGWGSAEYSAPEQSLGVLRRGSDIYALGVLLFRMLTGQPPFTGQTPVEVLLKHVRQPVPSARTLVPTISEAVDTVLQKAMQKRSDDRFASAEELSNAFSAAVTVAPVASPVAKSITLSASSPSSAQLQPVGNLHTPVPALHPAFPPGDQSLKLAPLSPKTRPLTRPLISSQPALDINQSSSGPEITEKRPAPFLQEEAAEDGHFFWSVDPVEWSPITNAKAGPVPMTANDYLQSKPIVTVPPRPEVPSATPAQASQKQDEQLETDRSAKLNKLLGQLLPIIVVILLLIGLLGALLSSFFYPSNENGHGAYILPSRAPQYIVVQVQNKGGSNG